MSELVLTATTGREEGTRSSRRLRREGRVPAVIYGSDGDPIAVSVDWPELRAALTTDAGLNAIITLDIEGSQQLSMVKDLQRHPVRRDVLHVDFIRVDADAEIDVEVPVILLGEAKKVTQQSGMVDHLLHTVSVHARLDAIPERLEVDISELDVGESIRVDDLVFPAGTRPAGDPEAAVAIGVITRSTMEAIRLDEIAEAEAEAELLEGEEGAAEGDDESSDDGGDDNADGDD